MPELRKGLEDKIGAVLNDTQKARIKEIRIQARGASALADKEVAEALKLTDDQVNKIKDLTDSAMKDMREAFQSAGNGGDRTAMREKMTKMRTETSEKLLAVLTADQKTAFEKMQGAKVEGLPQGGGGFGFGGGAGGGRRGGAGN
jgi:Spy/CpxP family protein refolding chaperone